MSICGIIMPNMGKYNLKIVQLSDLHFSKITFNPMQFFSKRWIGNFNLLLNRKKNYQTKKLFQLPELFKKLDVDFFFVAGDISSTSRKEEFRLAKDLIQSFDTKSFIVPGNHDQYTKKTYKNKSFYTFFESEALKNHGIEIHQLNEKWYYIGLDTTLPTPLLSCSGLFSEDLEEQLTRSLSQIDKKYNVILVNHFPFYQDDSKRKVLKRKSFLQDILKKFNNVKIYLHGHTHKIMIEDLQDEMLPISIGSGCASHEKTGSFNLIELDDKSCKVSTFCWTNNLWEKTHNKEICLK